MIEINLVPDIKQELIKAQRTRSVVVSIAILVGMASIAAIVILSLWVFAVQEGLKSSYDNSIKTSQEAIDKVDNLSDALTIQNQLGELTRLNDAKNIDSRLFGLLTTITPPSPNDVQISIATIDAEAKTVTIEAQAAGGFATLETYRKTISASMIEYAITNEDGTVEKKSEPLATNLSDIDRSFGEDADGKQVLRFTLVFTYADNLFSPLAKDLTVVAPTKRNATDSFLAAPDSLFTVRANDIKEGGE